MTLEEQEIKVNDIAYIQIDLVGENEIIKANSDKLLSISVEGGKFIALGKVPILAQKKDSIRATILLTTGKHLRLFMQINRARS